MNCSILYTRGNMTCMWSYSEASRVASCCKEQVNNGPVQCSQFCDSFKDVLPYIYFSVSILSALCCIWVFGTYFCLPRLRQTGYSSKVFLNRTLMDFVIAIGHIISGIFHLAESRTKGAMTSCAILGSVNELALIASNLWYIFLAVDLVKAIRNPFSSRPSYGWASQLIVWIVSLLCAGVLAALALPRGPGGPGRSMFYWCWVQAEQEGDTNKLEKYVLINFFFYYMWQFLIWVFSVVVIITAGCILWGHLAASSETRKFVLKQNLIYVLVLGIETVFILLIWIVQIVILSVVYDDHYSFYLTYYDLGLAIMFALIHSLRGTVDLFVWIWTFSIGPTDVSDCYRRYKVTFSTKKELQVPIPATHDLKTHLLITSKKDNLVNKALRRNAIYCINVGILDAVQLHLERCGRTHRIGSVRETFTAAAMLELDQKNERDELALLYNNPNYSEQVMRKIKFPASSSHLKEFAFIDLEPTVFSMLRESYGISPRTYRKSFEIKNAADIDSSRMLEKFTEGKSGSFFYFSQDYRFIIKTVTPSEEKFLCEIAYSYYTHMRDNKDSLIARLFGLHKVRLAPEQGYISVVVMENIFYNEDNLKIHRKFDLKGSWVGRRTLRKGNQGLDGYKGTLKDLDLGEEKIFIGDELKEQLMEQLQKDVQFLTSCRIMDYSLLLGIHHQSSSEDSSSRIFQTAENDGIVEVDMMDSATIFHSPEEKGVRTGTMTSMSSSEERELYVPWFRQDGGGLRSNYKMQSFSNDGNNDGRPVSVATDIGMVNVFNPPATYFFGVVDILQEYTLRKKVEHLWKTRVLRQNRHGLSAINEKAYGERFLNFLDSVIC